MNYIKKITLSLLLLTSSVFAQVEPNLSSNIIDHETPEPLTVTTKDGRYTLQLNSDYQNKFYDSKNFISARFINIVPNQDLTLLYQSPDTIVFGFSIPKPKDRNVPLRDLIQLITERLQNRDTVATVAVNDQEIHMGRVNYRVESQVDGTLSTEVCHLQLALESVDVICANSEVRTEHLEEIIDSIELN